jgi:hypothetical protein
MGARSGWIIGSKQWHQSGARVTPMQKLISAIGSAFPVVLLFAICFAVGGSLARYHVIRRDQEEAEKLTATHESIVSDAKFLKGREAILIEQLKKDRAATPKTALIEERIKEREADLADIQKRLKSPGDDARAHPP